MINGLRKVMPGSLDKWAKERLEREVEEITKDIYEASNRETEKLIGMNLGAFGYRV
jgi:hypothetical protein